MKYITTLFLSFLILPSNAQNALQQEIHSRLVDLHEVEDNNENFQGFERIKNEIGDAQIVMLGEQSHTDATTFQAKIKLIKYLHQEMGFDILAFESNIYDCDKAWSMIQEGHDVKDALAKGITDIWTTIEEFNPLYQYVEACIANEDVLRIAGFDAQLIGHLAKDYFVEDLTAYLSSFTKASVYQREIDQLDDFIQKTRKRKRIKEIQAVENIAFLQKIIALIKKEQPNDLSHFWIQTLESLIVFISDTRLGTDNRDRQMADNLIWLKEKYPDKKIICWGATSHFLYNSSNIRLYDSKMQEAAGDYYQNHTMMGDYIKDKYGDQVYTIGFIAHEGSFGFNRHRIIEPPLKNSLEYLIGNTGGDNYFLPLKNIPLEGYLSRPLAHQYMTNDISQVMDGVVFNRYMRRPYVDWDFLLYVVPENNMRAKKAEKLKQGRDIRKQRDDRERNERKKEAQKSVEGRA